MTGWLAHAHQDALHADVLSTVVERVEVWFGIVERQTIHRGTFGSVNDLTRRFAPSSTDLTERPLRVDQDRRRHPQESQPSVDFKHGPLVQGDSAVSQRSFQSLNRLNT